MAGVPTQSGTQDALIHPDAFRDLRSGAVQGGRLFVNLFVLLLAPGFWLVASPGIAGISLALAGTILAYRLSRLEGDQTAIKKVEVEIGGGVLGVVACLGFCKWVAGDNLFGAMLEGAAVVASLFFILFLRADRLWKSAKERYEKEANLTLVATEALKQEIDVITVNSEKVETLPVFTGRAVALRDAWATEKTVEIERLLMAGEAVTHGSWQTGMGIYNHATKTVDAARVNLQRTLMGAEGLLAKYAIDPAEVILNRSRTVTGETDFVLPKRLPLHKLNYSAPVAQVTGQAVRGNVPWQLVGVAAAASVVMQLINHSKLMRQLKEIEGKVLLNATATKGDLKQMSMIIKTRLLPQLTGLVEIAARLEAGMADLRASEGDPLAPALDKKAALRLAFSVAEGKQLMTMTAGD